MNLKENETEKFQIDKKVDADVIAHLQHYD